MGSGGVAIAALPTVICLKVPFSDGLGDILTSTEFRLSLPVFLKQNLLQRDWHRWLLKISGDT